MPEIDLVIGAHTHTANAGTRLGNVWYVQGEPHGKCLLKTSIYFDKKQRTVRQIESGFLPLRACREPLPRAARLPAAPVTGSVDFAAERIRKHYGSDLALYAVPQGRFLAQLMQKKQPHRFRRSL